MRRAQNTSATTYKIAIAFAKFTSFTGATKRTGLHILTRKAWLSTSNGERELNSRSNFSLDYKELIIAEQLSVRAR